MLYGGCRDVQHPPCWLTLKCRSLALVILVHPRAGPLCFHHIHLQPGFLFFLWLGNQTQPSRPFSLPLQLCLSVYTAVALFITFPVCALSRGGRSLSLPRFPSVCFAACISGKQPWTPLFPLFQFHWSWKFSVPWSRLQITQTTRGQGCKHKALNINSNSSKAIRFMASAPKGY